MKSLFKIIVMNYLLKNGDAHLKNFGVLYNEDFSSIYLAPAYDIVNTTCYFYNDRPALTLNGKKIWFGKKELIKFGIKSCYLKEADAIKLYETCIKALNDSILELKIYITKNKKFEKVGQKITDSWTLSLDEKSYKEIPSEIIRNWKQD